MMESRLYQASRPFFIPDFEIGHAQTVALNASPMKRLYGDAHQIWEVSPVASEESSSIITEARPYDVATESEGTAELFSLRRYWERRHEFWPNFDSGICTDVEGLFSVTPWDSACQIAAALHQYYPNDSPLIVDACCGVGGNTTAFARCIPNAVAIGIDTDPVRILCARVNSGVCGLSSRMDFVRDDAIRFMHGLRQSVRFVFSSPPWGGPGYQITRLEDFPFDIFALVNAVCACCVDNVGRLALFLPRNFSIDEAKRLTSKGSRMAKFDVVTGPAQRLIASCFVYDHLQPLPTAC
jgi:trimethylguanosine synthase